MSCEKAHGVATIRAAIERATHVPVTAEMWHAARKSAGREAKAKTPAEPDQAIAATKSMLQALNIDPNHFPESRDFLNDLESGKITLTRGQAEALRELPASIRASIQSQEHQPVPNEINEIVNDLALQMDTVEFEDNSGLFEEVSLFTIDDCDWIDHDSLRASRHHLIQEFQHLNPEDIKFEATAVSVSKLPAASLVDYMSDGDEDGRENVESLMDAYENGEDIPPILLIDYGPGGRDGVPFMRYDIVDGCHRAAAANEAGISIIPALVASASNPTGAGKDGWVNLANMEDPQAARNNCYAATHAVLEHVVEKVGVSDDWRTGTVELLFAGGVHWANTFTGPQKEEWVVDYTARQFDSESPIPYSAPRAVWQAWVSDRIQALHGQALHEVFEH